MKYSNNRVELSKKDAQLAAQVFKDGISNAAEKMMYVWNMLKHDALIAKFGVDTADNEPGKGSKRICSKEPRW